MSACLCYSVNMPLAFGVLISSGMVSSMVCGCRGKLLYEVGVFLFFTERGAMKESFLVLAQMISKYILSHSQALFAEGYLNLE